MFHTLTLFVGCRMMSRDFMSWPTDSPSHRLIKPMDQENIETIHESLQRCNRDPRFLDLFYEYFLNASPEVAAHFAHTDMKRQKRMVEASFYTCILAAEEVPYAVNCLEHLGEMHRERAIRPALYEVWLDSLVAAVTTADDAFDDGVERAWRRVMRSGINQMLATYDVDDRPS